MSYLESYKKIRKTWNINPTEQIVPNKKKKSRKKVKEDLKKDLKDEI